LIDGMQRKAKIIATIGPSSRSEAVLRNLINGGMNVARLNFSHGTQEEHAAVINLIRNLGSQLQKPITVLQDLQGPKLRVGMLPDHGIKLIEGQQVILFSRDPVQTRSGVISIPLDIPDFERSISIGDKILLNDGNIQLEALNVDSQRVMARVIVGGKLTSHKGVNLPGINIQMSGFTDKDRKDLEFGLAHGVDAIAISFVRSVEDIKVIRSAVQAIDTQKTNTPIIAKLERPEAIRNLDEIILQSDGVMVARGDLAVETSTASVPILQKRIIETANRNLKIVITATQMLESMVHNNRPTRAEASDVANAILDGSDAVMLSEETAAGEYPVESVRIMDNIIREAEAHYQKWGQVINFEERTGDDALSIVWSARTLARDSNVSAIAVFTRSGRTALLMSKVRPEVPIYSFTPDQRTYQWLGMLWGVKPFLVPFSTTVEHMISIVENSLKTSASVKPGQQIVIISGYPVGAFMPANLILLHTTEKPEK